MYCTGLFNHNIYPDPICIDISCTVLKSKYPNLPNVSYFLNPRGKSFQKFSVYYDMTTKVGIEVTEISHDSEAGIEVLNACPWSKNLPKECYI